VAEPGRLELRPHRFGALFQRDLRIQGEAPRGGVRASFASGLASALRNSCGFDEVRIIGPREEPRTDLVVEGDFLHLTTGSRAARFWVGFGAGRSKCEVKMECLVARDRSPVFTLAHGRLSAAGLSGDELQENVDEVLADITASLARARHGCSDPGSFQRTRQPASAPDSRPRAPAADEFSTADFESDPPDAEVHVDGFLIGMTPLKGYRLPPGQHAVVIDKRGYVLWARNMVFNPGSPTRVKVVLDAENPEPDPAEPPASPETP